MMEDQVRVLAEEIVEWIGYKTVDMVEVLVDFGIIVLERFSAKYMVSKLKGEL